MGSPLFKIRFQSCTSEAWICACVFSRNLIFFVNDSLIQKIIFLKGLEQGYPLTSFLFLLVIEGSSDLFGRTVDLYLFSGYKGESSNLVVSHLHQTYDTLMSGETITEDPWVIKSILRASKLMFFEVNVSINFMSMDEDFLRCK